MNDILLTAKEVADKLRMHPVTVRKKLKKGVIKGIRVGKRGDWRVKKEEMERLLK